MRDLMERFSAFTFSAGCISNSSIDVIGSQPQKSRADAVLTDELVLQSNGKTKTSSFPKPNNISAGIHKVLKGFKNMFQFYTEGDVDEEREMVIGLPTDVQHVAHIGWDGFNSSTGSSTTAIMKSCWDHKGPDLLSLPSISLRQFDLAMGSTGPWSHLSDPSSSSA